MCAAVSYKGDTLDMLPKGRALQTHMARSQRPQPKSVVDRLVILLIALTGVMCLQPGAAWARRDRTKGAKGVNATDRKSTRLNSSHRH